MKVKEIKRTANMAWSPSNLQSISVACGTVAQQLDATFSTSACLEVFSLDLASPGLDMSLLGTVESPHRFHKVVWSGVGVEGEHPSGLVVGGSDNGIITMWSADRIINSKSDALVAQISQHVGAVRSLDVNPFQPNLLASGAGESEIFIWDLTNPSTPMSPGNKLHPLEDISGVAWNRQVQHILASTSPGGRSVVWDLRKNEPIIQVTDSSSRVRCTGIAWHPDVATQMVTASGDDRAPVIQMWDLRYATAPMRILEHHKRGVLSIAWCPQDSDLLLSAAKDNQVLCWNPNSEQAGGEVVYELPATSQWIFEVHWCPRNPSIISTASFDGHISMYSLLGGGARGGAEVTTEQQSAAVPSDDVFAGIAAAKAQRATVGDSAPLKTPPKWFRRPCGARFAFGGKLVSFGNTRGDGTPKTVYVSQVTTEHELLKRSHDLEESLSQQQFVEFCEQKVQESNNEKEKNIWSFLKVTFEPEPRRQYLKLLGYDSHELSKKFSTWSKMAVSTLPAAGGLDVDELSHKLSSIPTTVYEEGAEPQQDETVDAPAKEMESSENSSTAAVFGSDAGSVFDTISSAPSIEVSARTSKRVSNASFMGVPSTPPPSILTPQISVSTDNDTDGMLSQALLVGNFEAAVDICVSADRMAEAVILAVAGGADLLQRTQQVFFQKKQTRVTKLISTVVNRNWTDIARYGSLENWRELLAAMVTYAGPEDFAPLCDVLGGRLENEMDGSLRDNAGLCYICSGNVEKFVEWWHSSSTDTESSVSNGTALSLQDLIEKVVLLKKAVERERKEFDSSSSETLKSKLRLYASLLASQGSLATALDYLQQTSSDQKEAAILYDRVYQAHGSSSLPRPSFPFAAVGVKESRAPEPVAQAQPPQPTVGSTAPSSSQPQPNPINSNPYMRGSSGVSGVSGVTGVSGVSGVTGVTGVGGGSLNYRGQPLPTPGLGGYGGYSTITQPIDPQPPGPAIMDPSSTISTGPLGPSVMQPGVPQPGVMPVSGGVSAPPIAPPPSRESTYPVDAPMTWNDPPNLKTKKTPNQPIAAPIKTPLMTPVQPVPDTQPLPQVPPTSHGSGGQAFPPARVQRKSSPSPAPVEKAPIPQEHMPMVQAFDGMLERCKGRASTTAIKRKLEDIGKKLSILYDLLREAKISPDVLQGLYYISQDAQGLNYNSGLMRYNQMVTTTNFSEISSFMPGIKALLQLGMQLRV